MNSRRFCIGFAVSLVAMFVLVSGAHAQSAWVSGKGATKLKKRNDNVGIGTARPKEKLHVTGAIRYWGLKQVDGAVVPYNVEMKRYYIEATQQNSSTVPLSKKLVNQLCRDIDGCSVTLGSRSADPAALKTLGTQKLFISRDGTNTWTSTFNSNSDTNRTGVDGDGQQKNLLVLNPCFVNDGEWINGASSDNVAGLGLLNLAGGPPDTVCFLIIDD